MNLEFIITISTMIIGFLGIIIMIFQQNQQINSRFDSLRNELKTEFKTDVSEIKTDINRIETRFESDVKELRGLILGLYSPRLIDKIDKQDAA